MLSGLTCSTKLAVESELVPLGLVGFNLPIFSGLIYSTKLAITRGGSGSKAPLPYSPGLGSRGGGVGREE